MECKLSVASKNNFGQQQTLLLLQLLPLLLLLLWFVGAALTSSTTAARSERFILPLRIASPLAAADQRRQRSRFCCRRFSSSRGMIRISGTPRSLLPCSIFYLALSAASLSLLSLPVSLCALLAFFSLGLFTFRSVEFSQRLLEPHRVKHSRFGFSCGFIADKAIGHKASAIHPSIHPSAIDYRFVCVGAACERLSVAIA